MKRIVVMIVAMLLCMATFAQTSQPSFSQLLTKARNGDVAAMVDVAIRYYDGNGVETNKRESFNWLLKAAQKGDVYAMILVAKYYYVGSGVEADEDEGFYWMLKAAEAGDVFAMEEIAIDYVNYGNDDEAYKWFSKAAEKGSKEAVEDLKKMKERGYVPKPGIAAKPKPNVSQPAENERKEYRDHGHVFVNNAAARANNSDPTVYDKTLHFNDPKALRCYGKIAKNGGELWVLYRPDGTLFGKFFGLTYFDKGAPNCFLFMRDFQTEKIGVYDIYGKKLLDDVKYNMKDFLEEWKKQVAIVQAEELAKLEASPNNPGTRITPDMITRLAPNEVFVFGSNEQGLHYGGAAKVAAENFGAIMGQGNGLQGMSYAIPSMSGLGVMGEYVKEFCEFAKAHPEKRFLVTEIGCGIAGYSISEVAPLFECCIEVENITLPASFWDILS